MSSGRDARRRPVGDSRTSRARTRAPRASRGWCSSTRRPRTTCMTRARLRWRTPGFRSRWWARASTSSGWARPTRPARSRSRGCRPAPYQLVVLLNAEVAAALADADVAYGGPGEGYAIALGVGEAAAQNVPFDITHTTVNFTVSLRHGDETGAALSGATVTLEGADGATVGSGETGEDGSVMLKVRRDRTEGNMVKASVAAEGYDVADGMTDVSWDPQMFATAAGNSNDIVNLNVDATVSGATVTTEYGGGDALKGWGDRRDARRERGRGRAGDAGRRRHGGVQDHPREGRLCPRPSPSRWPRTRTTSWTAARPSRAARSRIRTPVSSLAGTTGRRHDRGGLHDTNAQGVRAPGARPGDGLHRQRAGRRCSGTATTPPRWST